MSLYEFSVGALTRGLMNLSTILDKGAAYAVTKKFDSLILAQARLFPDMHPLVSQVQIACDTAKGAAGRLAAVDVPKHEDNEKTFEELKERIAKTLAFLQTIPPDKVNTSSDRPIELKFPNGSVKFTATSYVTDFVMPNFYFHESMVYALLRLNGVEVGKMDFLGALR